MSGSSFGKAFNITTFGESHGKGIGVVIQGCPPGLDLDEPTLLFKHKVHYSLKRVGLPGFEPGTKEL